MTSVKIRITVFILVVIEPNQTERKMYPQTVTVICPWCRNGFSVVIGALYKSAEAIRKEDRGSLGIDEGINTRCPNIQCNREIFIHFIK